MIVFIRCNDIISDSRAEKYIEFYKRIGCDYKIIAWDRLGNSEKMQNAIYCPVKSKYNQGGIRAVIDRLKWMFFILKTLFTFKDNLRIHACDLDAAFPATLYKLFSRRNNYVIFDVFDWISDTLYNQGKIVTLTFKFMENFSVKMSDYIVICEPEREKQIPYQITNKLFILPNIPSVANYDFMYEDKLLEFTNDKLTLSYVGGLYGERFLDELLTIASKGFINLLIAGYGDEKLEQKCKILNKLDNVRFFGKVTYTEGLHIMYNSDMIYAMYCKTNPNHIFAAPNKFYESMLLSKAIISTKGTIVGDKIEKLNIGYTIEENIKDLEKLINKISIKDVKIKSQNAHNLWENKYKDYVTTFLEKDYYSLIRQ